MTAYTNVGAKELRERLAPLLLEHPTGALAFDADGTLWAHDVGCMAFDYAWQEGLLRAAVREFLADELRKNRLPVPEGADQNELARLLGAAFERGECDDQGFAEMQVWCYAGMTEAEMRALTREALRRGNHLDTLHREVLALADWARSAGVATLVVSASPRWVVEESAHGLGFDLVDVSGGVPAIENGLIAPRMAEPLPYGPGKVTEAFRKLGNRTLIAGFGDSTFDLDLLRAARLGVGLGRKPAFLAELARIPGAVHLGEP